MASTNKTTHLQLNIYIATDKPQMTDFNADNQAIDLGFKTINDAVTALQDVLNGMDSFLDNVILPELEGKQDGINLTPGKVLITNESGSVIDSTLDSSILSFLTGLKSNAQKQINEHKHTMSSILSSISQIANLEIALTSGIYSFDGTAVGNPQAGHYGIAEILTYKGGAYDTSSGVFCVQRVMMSNNTVWCRTKYGGNAFSAWSKLTP